MDVQLIAHTIVLPNQLAAAGFTPDPDADDMDTLGEFAGRACYQSFHKPNPATAANSSYLAHIEDEGHFSVLEHASATFYCTGISRSLTHELIRHRHLSYSQLSQRFVDPVEKGTGIVVPPLFADDEGGQWILKQAEADAAKHYEALLIRAAAIKPESTRKQKREAARAVLPGGTETRLVVTGNLRAWRDVLTKRYHVAADAEIAEFAGEILRWLRAIAPASVQDIPQVPYRS